MLPSQNAVQTTYLEEQCRSDDGQCEEDASHEIGQRKWKFFEKLDVAKQRRILLGGLGKETAKGRAKDGAYRPDQGHDGKCLGLKYLLGNHLGNHGPDNANYDEMSVYSL